MITCTRRLQFCAGHRVFGHESKCAHLHGHNYVVLITAKADLDSIGRVIDFAVLKECIGGWIEKWWDHGFLLFYKDPVVQWMENLQAADGVPQKVYRMPTNPTAENMAEFLLREVCPAQLEGTGVQVTHVRVWETENCYAESVDADA